MTDLTATTLAFTTALVATRLVERWARNRDLLDRPNDRSSHVVPTPRLGGVGIVAGSVVATLLIAGSVDVRLRAIVGAGLFIAAVGLFDDVRRTSVLAKNAAQVLAAVVVVMVIQPVLSIDLPGVHLLIDGPAALILATIGLVALINAFNFMDGIDGLVGGVTVVICITAAGVVAGAGPLALPLAAATLGFLVWNQAPASVFMGDVGSHFLGLFVGASFLVGQPVPVVPAGLVLAPFLLDTGFTLVRRGLAGKNLFAAHREHLYQRLVRAGRGHREVAAGYALATAILGAVALAWGEMPGVARVLALGAVIVAAIAYIRWVRGQEGLASPG
jgi:UDP-N-acetylmuramyl pentapeptide phosphotransferase/UDP-N-acetylglucosamine-1-phosphate transferase